MTNKNLKKVFTFNKEIPSLYDVVIYDDNSVPRSLFNIAINRFFKKEFQLSESKFENGKRKICFGSYTRDVAETKVYEVSAFISSNNHDLECVIQRSLYHADQKS